MINSISYLITHWLAEFWLVLPTIIKIINCSAATLSAIKIFNYRGKTANSRCFIRFIAWGLFLSFASIPIFTLFDEHNNHTIFETNVNVFLAVLLWSSGGSISPVKIVKQAA